MKRFLIGAGYGVIGLAVAIALTLGAYAVAGQDLSRPANPVGAGKALGPARTSSSPGDALSAARKEQLRQHRIALRHHQRQVEARQQAGQPIPVNPRPSDPNSATGSNPTGGSTDNSSGSSSQAGPGGSGDGGSGEGTSSDNGKDASSGEGTPSDTSDD